MAGFRRVWAGAVHRIAGLPEDVTPHVLRHAYASLAADRELADSTIVALFGHIHERTEVPPKGGDVGPVAGPFAVVAARGTWLPLC